MCQSLLNKKLILLFFVLFIFLEELYTQIADFEWKNPVPIEIIPDSMTNNDAIILSSSRSIYITQQYHKEVIIYRIKLLSQKAVLENSTLIFERKWNQTFYSLDARVIKPDLKTLDVDPDDIKMLITPGLEDFYFFVGEYRMAVPGIEVGDVIEIRCEWEIFDFISSADIFLNNRYPVLHANVKIKFDVLYFLDYKCYNDFPLPEVSIDSTSIITLEAEIKNLIPLDNLEYASIYEQVPHLSYSLYLNWNNIIFNGEPNWYWIYNYYTNQMEDDIHYMNRRNYLFNLVDRYKRKYNKIPKEEVFDSLYYYIRDNVEVGTLKSTELGFHAGYYLSIGKIDIKHLRIVYRKVLDQLGIDYFIGLVRERNKGPIDKQFIRFDELKNLFFGFKCQDGSISIYFPSSLKLEKNEIPPDFYSSTALLVIIENDSVQLKELKFPSGNKESNSIKRNVQHKIFLEAKESRYKQRNTLSGAYSTIWRPMIDSLALWIRQDSLISNLKKHTDIEMEYGSLDTLYVENFNQMPPFQYRYCVTGSKMGITKKLDENVYSILIGDIIKQNILQDSDKKRYLDLVIPFPNSDEYNAYIVFNEPVLINNLEKLQFQTENSLGAFSSSVNQINDTTLLISSDYIISAERLPIKEYQLLRELNNCYRNFTNSFILLEKQ